MNGIVYDALQEEYIWKGEYCILRSRDKAFSFLRIDVYYLRKYMIEDSEEAKKWLDDIAHYYNSLVGHRISPNLFDSIDARIGEHIKYAISIGILYKRLA